jgi:isopentenyl-diphosphate delta-isomerase
MHTVAATQVLSGGVAATDSNLHDTITAIDTCGGFYPIDKLDAHIDNVPHVAISIFLFHDRRLLLQRRAESKYHSGGLWANTVCSHPRWNESVEACAGRRLSEELGLRCDVIKFGEITYQAKVGDLYENEHVHCLIGQLDEDYAPHEIERLFNPLEVSEIAFLELPQIQSQIDSNPHEYTEWFKIYMSHHRALIHDALAQC